MNSKGMPLCHRKMTFNISSTSVQLMCTITLDKNVLKLVFNNLKYSHKNKFYVVANNDEVFRRMLKDCLKTLTHFSIATRLCSLNLMQFLDTLKVKTFYFIPVIICSSTIILISNLNICNV